MQYNDVTILSLPNKTGSLYSKRGARVGGSSVENIITLIII